MEELENSDITIKSIGDEEEKPSTITFIPDKDMPWIMKICKIDESYRIVFNREDYPNALQDDFAREVCKLIEICPVFSKFNQL